MNVCAVKPRGARPPSLCSSSVSAGLEKQKIAVVKMTNSNSWKQTLKHWQCGELGLKALVLNPVSDPHTHQ